MRIKKLKSGIFALIMLVLVSFTIKDDLGDKNRVILELMMDGLRKNHYQKHKIDNDFSEKVFNMYIDDLDYSKRFFLQSDIDNFEKFKYKIDDEIEKSNFELFNLTKDIYKQRIKEVKKYYTKILKRPFNFDKEENFETDPEKRKFSKSKKELKESWRKLLKYQVMAKLATKLIKQEELKKNNDSSASEPKTFKELEKKSRKEVLKIYDDWYHRITKVNDKDLISIYLNSIASLYDPHTQYFPPKDKENFDIRMSGKLEGIGATLSQPDAYIKVMKIVPGSACWKQGELEAGDLILKVAQADSTPVNVVDMRMDDAIKMIRGKKGTEVRLTVRKADGSEKVISIIRDIVILEETFAKSTVISDSISNKKIAYIYLPSFYADFKNPSGRRCSEDMKKEIVKLKKDNIDGMIIDLRNNGGGSLRDVVKIVGFFIEKGPVVQVRGRYGLPQMLEDKDSTVLYDGPLVVMINEYSASASEIMAAAIQDYDRGFVVGSNQTYGKGTVQRFLPFDRVNGYNHLKPLGDLKITTQKFYRINGGSTQLKGVNSDIVLPDIYAKLETGEKDTEYPIEWDEIIKADYKIIENNTSKKMLIENSKKRISSDTTFQIISKYADYMKETRDNSLKSLKLSEYKKILKSKDKKNKKYKNAIKRKSDLIFNVPTTDSTTVYADSIKISRFENWKKNLGKDVYIEEVFNIVNEIK